MVKEVVVQAELDCSVQEFFAVIYKDAEATEDFHREVDGDEATEVGPWVDQQRVVVFRMPVQVPGFIRKVLGTDTIRVTETSSYAYEEDGTLVVSTKPDLEIPGNGTFTTSAEMRAAPAGRGKCRLMTTVTCKAGGPWGLAGTFEDVMAKQASVNVAAFLEFCKARCASHKERIQAALPEAPALDAPPTSQVEEADTWYDAPDNGSTLGGSVSSASLAGVSSSMDIASAGEEGAAAAATVAAAQALFPSSPAVEHAMLRYMAHLCDAAQETGRLLHSVQNRLHLLEAEVAGLKQTMQTATRPRTQIALVALAAGIGAGAAAVVLIMARRKR